MSIRLTTLPNGLRIITDPARTIESLAIGVWVGVGTRHENLTENGIAHMLEHMMFKGTTTRSTKDISDLVENAGGHYNAYTAKEMTAYYIRILDDHLDLTLDILADILQNSLFPEEEIERERSVILQEIKMYEDSPDDMVFENAQKAAFPDQSLGASGLGEADIVSRISRNDLKTYMGKHYTTNQIVISAAGDIDHDLFVKKVEALFTSLPAGTTPSPVVTARYAPRHILVQKDIEQAHLIIGFEGLSRLDPSYQAQRIFSNILGGGASSRLWQEIREKHGLVYSIQTYQDSYQDGGLFGIYAGTGPDELEKLVPLAIDQIRSMRDGITANELARAKTQITSSVRMGREKMMTRADQQGRYVLSHGTNFDIARFTEKINEITEQDIKHVADKILSSQMMISAYGPIGKLMPPEDIRQKLAA